MTKFLFAKPSLLIYITNKYISCAFKDLRCIVCRHLGVLIGIGMINDDIGGIIANDQQGGIIPGSRIDRRSLTDIIQCLAQGTSGQV